MTEVTIDKVGDEYRVKYHHEGRFINARVDVIQKSKTDNGGYGTTVLDEDIESGIYKAHHIAKWKTPMTNNGSVYARHHSIEIQLPGNMRIDIEAGVGLYRPTEEEL